MNRKDLKSVCRELAADLERLPFDHWQDIVFPHIYTEQKKKQDITVDLHILEKEEGYLHIGIAVSDDHWSRQLWPVTSSFIVKESSKFLGSEFRGQFTVHSLLEAIIAGGVIVPEATTEIESLNKLLSGESLHAKLKGVTLPEEATRLIERVASLNENERIRLNRLIIKSAYPLKCPKELVE